MGTEPNIKILVCCHKPCEVPNDDIFMPIQVGKAISDIDLGFQGDDTGDNISAKNKSYCELTAMYWAWKNLKGVDYIGLCHYRRYFNFNSHSNIEKKVIEQNLYNRNLLIIDKNLKENAIIVAKQKIYPFNLFTDYSSCHISEDMKMLEKTIHSLYPEYDSAYKKIMFYNNKLSLCNMFICKWDIFNNYCSWLFPLLSELEQKINIENYNDVQKRIFGYMGERLMNIYIEKNRLKKIYHPIIFINENGIKVNKFKHQINNIRNRCSFLFNRPWNTKYKQ